MKRAGKSGFTLIELLVVIAIIGLLAAIVLTSLNSAKVKTRDTQRKAAFHQIQRCLLCKIWVLSIDFVRRNAQLWRGQLQHPGQLAASIGDRWGISQWGAQRPYKYR
jgi:prepilin-type N-terminal cleavage/methylation domain-containing protein